MNRLVVATHNRAKAGEMISILRTTLPDLELFTLADFPGAPEPEETGETYPENASIKARSASEFTGEWSIADDAGLEIDALGGEPGVHSKRFEGVHLSFPDKMRRILARMEGVPADARSARFQCSVALAAPGSEPILFAATCEGLIAVGQSGSGGFGYDPIFYLPELGCTMAELAPEQKHAVSHRGKVLREVIEFLRANPI